MRLTPAQRSQLIATLDACGLAPTYDMDDLDGVITLSVRVQIGHVDLMTDDDVPVRCRDDWAAIQEAWGVVQPCR